jgi:riboflavin kinase/FMN adenylyltransferase
MVSHFAEECNFEVLSCEPVTLKGEVVSSTEIRKSIVQGNLQRAKRMLGRRVSMLGTVVRGDGRGRDLGYPTANLNLHHEIRPPTGVYATKVLLGSKDLCALTNIGMRPTFKEASQESEPLVEVHIIDLMVLFMVKIWKYSSFIN